MHLDVEGVGAQALRALVGDADVCEPFGSAVLVRVAVPRAYLGVRSGRSDADPADKTESMSFTEAKLSR